MATSFVNIGAASQGAWDVIAFTSDDASVTLFTMDVSATSAAGTIGNAAGKTYLSAAPRSLLTGAGKQMVAFYGQAALAGSAALTEAAMRKVVGVINMDDGPINIGVAIVGTTATLSANPGGVPRRFAMYVPNAAGAGFFTGDGAGQESAPPVGPAGGVLGYPGSTYPNPSGLATIANALPIHGPGDGSTVAVKPDASTGATVAGDAVAYSGANGSAGTVGDVAGAGGSIAVTGGNAGVNGGAGGANGGEASIQGGTNTGGGFPRAATRINPSGRSPVYIGNASKPTGFLTLYSTPFLLGDSGAINANPFALTPSGFVWIATGGIAADIELDPPDSGGQMLLFVNSSGQPQTFNSTANQRVGNAGVRVVNDGGSIMFFAASLTVWSEISFTDTTV
jgi:hypothetical protein